MPKHVYILRGRGKLRFLYYLSSMQIFFGTILMGLFVYLLAFAHPLVRVAADAYTDHFAIWILLCIGAPMLLTGVLGCVAVAKTNRGLLMTYTLLSLFILAAISALMAYSICGYWQRFEDGSYELTHQAITTLYGEDKWTTGIIDLVQSSRQCCGNIIHDTWAYSKFNKYEDVYPYLKVKYKIPESCCKDPGSLECDDVGMRPYLSREQVGEIIYIDGCLDHVKEYFRFYVQIPYYVAIVLGFINFWCAKHAERLPETQFSKKLLRSYE